MAIPNTPPSSRIALFAPEAMPSWSRRTDASTTLATGAKNSDMPTPATMNAGTSVRYATVGLLTAASQPRPAACSASPPASRGRPPMRSERAPATGATRTGMPVHGSVRKAGLQRRVMLHDLQELRQQEDGAEHATEHQQ